MRSGGSALRATCRPWAPSGPGHWLILVSHSCSKVTSPGRRDRAKALSRPALYRQERATASSAEPYRELSVWAACF